MFTFKCTPLFKSLKVAIPLLLFAIPSWALDVQVSLSSHVTDDGSIIVDGETNFPEEAKGIVKLTAPSGYSGQDDFVVEHGKFKAGPFTDNGKSLPTGTVIIQSTFASADAQPKIVQSLIGENGEKLSGSFVRQSEFGLGKIVSVSENYEFDGAAIESKIKLPPKDLSLRSDGKISCDQFMVLEEETKLAVGNYAFSHAHSNTKPKPSYEGFMLKLNDYCAQWPNEYLFIAVAESAKSDKLISKEMNFISHKNAEDNSGWDKFLNKTDSEQIEYLKDRFPNLEDTLNK